MCLLVLVGAAARPMARMADSEPRRVLRRDRIGLQRARSCRQSAVAPLQSCGRDLADGAARDLLPSGMASAGGGSTSSGSLLRGAGFAIPGSTPAGGFTMISVSPAGRVGDVAESAGSECLSVGGAAAETAASAAALNATMAFLAARGCFAGSPANIIRSLVSVSFAGATGPQMLPAARKAPRRLAQWAPECASRTSARV